MEKKHLGASESPKSLTIFWSFPKISHPFLLFNFPLFKTHCFLPKKKTKSREIPIVGPPFPYCSHTTIGNGGPIIGGPWGNLPPKKGFVVCFNAQKHFCSCVREDVRQKGESRSAPCGHSPPFKATATSLQKIRVLLEALVGAK